MLAQVINQFFLLSDILMKRRSSDEIGRLCWAERFSFFVKVPSVELISCVIVCWRSGASISSNTAQIAIIFSAKKDLWTRHTQQAQIKERKLAEELENSGIISWMDYFLMTENKLGKYRILLCWGRNKRERRRKNPENLEINIFPLLLCCGSLLLGFKEHTTHWRE